jgi:hypothetical protein
VKKACLKKGALKHLKAGLDATEGPLFAAVDTAVADEQRGLNGEFVAGVLDGGGDDQDECECYEDYEGLLEPDDGYL